MEQREMQMMQSLQTTIQMQNEKSHHYLKLTGQERGKESPGRNAKPGMKITYVKP